MDAAAIARRALGMLFRPTTTWEAVAAETTTVREVMLGYVAPLAAIPAVCGVIGSVAFGITFADVGLHQHPVAVVLEAAAGFVLTMAGVWLGGQLLARVSGLFGGVADPAKGLRLAGHAGTAVWVAGLCYLLPGLQIPAALLGLLWSLWLLYRGLPILLGVPEDQLLTCFAANLLSLGLIVVLRGLLVSKAAELGGPLSLS